MCGKVGKGLFHPQNPLVTTPFSPSYRLRALLSSPGLYVCSRAKCCALGRFVERPFELYVPEFVYECWYVCMCVYTYIRIRIFDIDFIASQEQERKSRLVSIISSKCLNMCASWFVYVCACVCDHVWDTHPLMYADGLRLRAPSIYTQHWCMTVFPIPSSTYTQTSKSTENKTSFMLSDTVRLAEIVFVFCCVRKPKRPRESRFWNINEKVSPVLRECAPFVDRRMCVCDFAFCFYFCVWIAIFMYIIRDTITSNTPFGGLVLLFLRNEKQCCVLYAIVSWKGNYFYWCFYFHFATTGHLRSVTY